MARPIVLNEEDIQKMALEFAQTLRNAKLSDGKVSYSKSFTYESDGDDGATVLFTPLAYAKMLMLLHNFDSEIAWHGFVNRAADDCFVITDVIVYPQVVTGATVNTDQEEYQQWLMGIDDERFNSMHFQAHSHVNMSVTPSSTDLAHQESILSQVSDEDFYIFMIINKKLDRNIKIYDMKNNVLYENADIRIGIAEECDLDGFVKNAKELAKKRTTTPASQAGARNVSPYAGGYGYGYGGGYGGYAGGYGRSYDDFDDDDAPAGKGGKSAKSSGKSKGGKKSEKTAPATSQYPGYFGGSGEDHPDYDRMMFGDRR